MKMLEKDSHLQFKERGLGRNQLSENLDLGLLPSRAIGNTFLLFKSVVFCYDSNSKLKQPLSLKSYSSLCSVSHLTVFTIFPYHVMYIVCLLHYKIHKDSIVKP